MSNFFETKIEFLKGVGPQKASLLNTELRIFNYGDLLHYYPFRYEDRSVIHKISDIDEETQYVQLRGKIVDFTNIGGPGRKRLVATFGDETGMIELVWFQGIKWVSQSIKQGVVYLIYGKPQEFGRKYNIAHPEIELYNPDKLNRGLVPVYNSSEKLKNGYLDSKGILKLQEKLAEQISGKVKENLPEELRKAFTLVSREYAYKNIHFPADGQSLDRARRRLKFEELFYIQFKLLSQKITRKNQFRGQVFKNIPTLNDFYKNHLPFDLTEAQKKVIREIYKDLCSGKQMNRLLQGDVGSGKTIVAFITMLTAIDNGAQGALMAPTEILAEQHYRGLKEFADKINISIALLTGSTKQKERKEIFERLENGSLHILIGTHALLEDTVQFKNLGICIIDEQHRFGVAQRAKLWKKNPEVLPHILVMTATPIPRTLAMTLYGDLDVSVIDQLPSGRKPIKTVARNDSHRIQVFGFMRKQIEEGRQVYVVYPLIEESETLDLKDLEDGHNAITRAFPEYAVGILHGRMKQEAKDWEMKRFLKGESKIMVATTVIEVGVNVPNASVMVIENAERFGLSQLHQLRGRVGRGADQSYCILMVGDRVSKESKFRIETMCRTNNGFEIADADLKLRGPGDLTGTKQSGALDLLLADLSSDAELVKSAREAAEEILNCDPKLEMPQHSGIRDHINSLQKTVLNWGRIS